MNSTPWNELTTEQQHALTWAAKSMGIVSPEDIKPNAEDVRQLEKSPYFPHLQRLAAKMHQAALYKRVVNGLIKKVEDADDMALNNTLHVLHATANLYNAGVRQAHDDLMVASRLLNEDTDGVIYKYFPSYAVHTRALQKIGSIREFIYNEGTAVVANGDFSEAEKRILMQCLIMNRAGSTMCVDVEEADNRDHSSTDSEDEQE